MKLYSSVYHKSILTIVSVFAFECLLAQPASEFSNYKTKYPDDAIIYLQKKRDITISFENNALQILSRDYEERMLLQDNANIYAENSVEYSGFSPLLSLSAKSLLPESKKYKEVLVESYKTNDVMDGAIFHDDTKEKKFYFPSLAAGVKTVLEYQKQLNEPRFIGGFFFGGFAPIEEAKYNITCPKEVQLDISYFNMKESDVIFTKKESKGNIIYTWQWKNIQKLKLEPGAPDIRYYIPHVVAYIKNYSIAGQKINLANNIDDLHNWYYSFIENLDSSTDIQLKKIVDSLVFGITDETEKVKQIYYWVQSNIKYVAFEEGMDGFVPRQASAICNKRYGDCKDMANIITEMLNMADINAHLTWIGSRDIPYKYSDIPAPIVDNHMIAAYKINGTYQFLDATEDHLMYGIPSSFIQGKQALINLDKEHYEIVIVPVVDAYRNKIEQLINIHIDGNKLIGESSEIYTGYFQSNMCRKISGVKTDERTLYLAKSYQQGNNTFQLDTFYVNHLEDRDKALEANYSFHVRDYFTQTKDEIYLNMNLDKILQLSKIDDDRTLPLEKEFKSTIDKTIVLDIPANFRVEYLPENNSYSDSLFSYSMSYEKTNTQITMTLKIIQNHLFLYPENFKSWNQMIAKLNNAYSETVILKKEE